MGPKRRPSRVAPISIYKYTRRERRESVPHVEIFNEILFVKLLTAHPNGKGWFKRVAHIINDKGQLRRGAVDECKATPGVYEVGIAHSAYGDDISVVYVGKSSNVRQRILSQYCLKGDKLANDLRPYLEEGFEVYFRWRHVDTINDAVRLEYELLSTYDYAFNRSVNPPTRPVLWQEREWQSNDDSFRILEGNNFVYILRNIELINLQKKEEAEKLRFEEVDDETGGEIIECSEEYEDLLTLFEALGIDEKNRFREYVNTLR